MCHVYKGEGGRKGGRKRQCVHGHSCGCVGSHVCTVLRFCFCFVLFLSSALAARSVDQDVVIVEVVVVVVVLVGSRGQQVRVGLGEGHALVLGEHVRGEVPLTGGTLPVRPVALGRVLGQLLHRKRPVATPALNHLLWAFLRVLR